MIARDIIMKNKMSYLREKLLWGMRDGTAADAARTHKRFADFIPKTLKDSGVTLADINAPE